MPVLPEVLDVELGDRVTDALAAENFHPMAVDAHARQWAVRARAVAAREEAAEAATVLARVPAAPATEHVGAIVLYADEAMVIERALAFSSGLCHFDAPNHAHALLTLADEVHGRLLGRGPRLDADTLARLAAMHQFDGTDAAGPEPPEQAPDAELLAVLRYGVVSAREVLDGMQTERDPYREVPHPDQDEPEPAAEAADGDAAELGALAELAGEPVEDGGLDVAEWARTRASRVARFIAEAGR